MSRALLGFTLLLALHGSALAAEPTEQNTRLSFMVGEWTTEHQAPSDDGETIPVLGNATIEWTLGGTWLRHDFDADFPGRGPVFMSLMMNFVPGKNVYNICMFDHFGGDVGVFYGDWRDEKTLEFKARFEETDGSTSHQKITLTNVSDTELWVTRGFSDDGEHYHFELKGVYTRSIG